MTHKPKNTDDDRVQVTLCQKTVEMNAKAVELKLTGKAILTVNYADGIAKNVEILVPERSTI